MSTTVDADVRTTPTAPPTATRLRRVLLGRDAAIVALLAATWLIATVAVPNFGTANTVYFLLEDIFPVLLIALPMTLVIITGEIDLSVGSMVGLSTVVVGSLFDAGLPFGVAALVAVLVGAVGGLFNGVLVTRVGLPSLAVTIGTLALYRGLAVATLGDKSVTGFPQSWKDLVQNRLFGAGTALPTIIWLFLLLAAFFIVLLHFTSTGRAVYAIGLNDEAARFSGIDAGRVKMLMFVATGTVAALAGVWFTLYYSTARGDNATGLELSVVAAVLVGGVSIFGGKGGLPGVIAGALLIGTLRSALRLADVSSDAINVATGLLLVVTVIVPSFLAWLGRVTHRGS
ncbi:ABC transporter permease [Actinotalea sp. M2MS4P-6]|uniref:ABC transporter permease n=1 Tax=Actinotalea sp. M2MS4P-6 TaxID=2983762 RepID=UPI0021E40264|nr:ABC transporter permease [Actinotalea sp. M2MS4P-6]MCV2394186.1 ABC transporter permease [Actinotalea sp. M2MS4P-6]